MADDDNLLTPSRRNLLKGISATGAYLTVGGANSTGAVTVETGDTVQLGEFSDGLNGWTTTGRNELTRVNENEMPVAVTTGSHALAVAVDGDRHPMIENKRRVRNADFEEYPYLLANVVGFADETDSDLVVTFRLHHSAGPSKGGGKSSGDGKDVLVEESDEQTVAQLNPALLRWDMTDLDEEVRRTTKRLEIWWYFEDHPPERGARGRQNGDIHGRIMFDDIRLTDEVARAEAAASQEKKLDLHRKHGMIIEREFDERSEDIERGTLVFGDGTEIVYVFEVLDDGRFRYTIDDETFVFGGGQE